MKKSNEKSDEIKFSGIIKTSMRIYFENIFAWLIICLAVYLPMNVCTYLIPQKFSYPPNIINAIYSLKLFSMAICLLPSILFNPLGIAAISFIVQQSLFNKPAVLSKILDNSLMKWKDLVWTSVLYYAIIFLTGFLIIPSIYFSISFYFSITIVALSKLHGINAMMISRISLVGRWFKAAGLIFLSLVMSTLTSILAVSIIPAEFVNFLGGKLIISLVNEFIDIFFKIILIVWFLSISVIKTDEKEAQV